MGNLGNRYKISVIVPIYNTAAYIERCAISLFEQTLEDIEYIFSIIKYYIRVNLRLRKSRIPIK